MNRYVTLFCLATLSLYATDSKDLVIEKLVKEVESLKESVSELKKNQIIVQTKQKEDQAYVDELYDFAENTETRVLEDKLKFGISFKTSMDNFSKKYADGHKVGNNNMWSNKLMLNAKANITKDMKIYTRLSMYKYWGNGTKHLFDSYDNMQGRVPADSALYVERAYLDWLISDNYIPIAITIGRQPSADGPSHQFKDNTTRKATYSALLYDGAADGLVLTLNISKLLKNKNSLLRFGYAKGFAYSESSTDVTNAYVGASNNDLKDTNVFGVFFDTTIPSIKHSLVQLSYSKISDIIANQLDTDTTENVNIGNVNLFGAMVEITNFKNTNLDMFLHYGHVTTDPNSQTYLDYGALLCNNQDISSVSGDAVWVGTRYSFGNKKKYKFGVEYNHGSKNWVSLTQGSFDVYNKLATRGDAYEVYAMYEINRYANIRLGYVNINYDYSKSGWFLGKPQEINNSVSNLKTELKQLQSIYLKMSVKY